MLYVATHRDFEDSSWTAEGAKENQIHVFTSKPDVIWALYAHAEKYRRSRLNMDTNAQKTSSQALLSCGNGRGLVIF